MGDFFGKLNLIAQVGVAACFLCIGLQDKVLKKLVCQ